MLCSLSREGRGWRSHGHVENVMPKDVLTEVAPLAAQLLSSERRVTEEAKPQVCSIKLVLTIVQFWQDMVIFHSALVLIGNTKQGLYVQIMEAWQPLRQKQMHVSTLAQWCPKVSKTHWTEAKSLGRKWSRAAGNPATEGAHTPSAESITIPRKIKTKQNKREREPVLHRN